MMTDRNEVFKRLLKLGAPINALIGAARSAEGMDKYYPVPKGWVDSLLAHAEAAKVAWEGIVELVESMAKIQGEREIACPPPEMGMKMEDVRVGMRMKSLYGGPVITVTEMTEKGFKYSHPPYHLSGWIGHTTGGEHYGHNGSSHYTETESKQP